MPVAFDAKPLVCVCVFLKFDCKSSYRNVILRDNLTRLSRSRNVAGITKGYGAKLSRAKGCFIFFFNL